MQPRTKYQLKIVLGVSIMLGSYCAASGRFDLWPGWCISAFSLLSLTISYLIAARAAPDLMVERVSFDAGVKRWDKPIALLLMCGPVAACLVAGLEARRSGRPPVDLAVFFGYALAAAGSA